MTLAHLAGLMGEIIGNEMLFNSTDLTSEVIARSEISNEKLRTFYPIWEHMVLEDLKSYIATALQDTNRIV